MNYCFINMQINLNKLKKDLIKQRKLREQWIKKGEQIMTQKFLLTKYKSTIEECQKILGEYLKPGLNSDSPIVVISNLLEVLDNQELVKLMKADVGDKNLGRKKIVIQENSSAQQPFHYNIIGANGQIMSTSENFSAKQMVKQSAKSIIEDPPTSLYEIDNKTWKEVKIW